MRRSRAELIGPILAILTGASVARAQAADHPSNDAQAHIERGLSLYEAKDYAHAAAELEVAYDLKKDRDVLYALAQSKRLAGDCATALVHYRQYLDSNPPSRQADLARKNMARCEETKPVPPAPTPLPSAPVVSPIPSSSPAPDSHASVRALEPTEPTRPPRAAWYRDVPGDLLLGGGVVAGVVGGYFLYTGGSELEAARSASRYDDAQAHTDRAHRDREAAVVGGAVAGALVVAAILRYVLHDDSAAGRRGVVATF